MLGLAASAVRRGVVLVPRRHTAAPAYKQSVSPSTPSITITEDCAARIKKVNEKDNSSPLLRLSVVSGGCSGMKYDFKWEKEADSTDVVFERDGAVVLVDPESLKWVSGSKVGVKSEMMKYDFKWEK
eukprot:Sspe_Gene.1123::Locus_381_Transcript_1_1_Confidence_1.000_Length_518::g.1123::m.1123/K22072/ISCA2; iron-sulfur cluster assembly 2